MNEQYIIESAPDDNWTHYSPEDNKYFRKAGPFFKVWLEGTQVWSVPLSESYLDLRQREDIKTIHDLTARLAALESPWISIEKRVPDHCNPVLVARHGRAPETCNYLFGNWSYDDVTHWMEIPELPVANKKHD